MNFAVVEEERRGRRFCGLKSDNVFIGLSSDHPIVESSENKSGLEIRGVQNGRAVSSSSSSSSPNDNGQGKAGRTSWDEPHSANSNLAPNRIDKVRAAQMKESHSLDFSQVEVAETRTGKKQYRQINSLNYYGEVDLPASKLDKKTYSHTHGCRIQLG